MRPPPKNISKNRYRGASAPRDTKIARDSVVLPDRKPDHDRRSFNGRHVKNDLTPRKPIEKRLRPTAGHMRRPGKVESSWIYGRREILELLESNVEVKELLVLESGEGEVFERILTLTEAKGVAVRSTDRREFDFLFPGETHQGVAASFRAQPPAHLSDLLAGGRRTLVLLDGVTDPHNLGAVIRSAEVFGADGVVIPSRRAAGLTPVAIKSSAGAALRIPVATVTNLAQTVRLMKKTGFWVYGLDPGGEKSLWETEFGERACFIFGSEGRGLARLTRELCDNLITIPQSGQIGSLNVSASAAVVMAELSRRSEKKGKKVDL